MTRKNRVTTLARRAWLWLPIGLLFIIGLLLPGSTAQANDPIVTPVPWKTMRWSTETMTVAAVAPRESRPTGHPKLESSLNQLLETQRRAGAAEAQAFAASHNLVLQDGRVQVKIVTTGEAIDDVRKAVEAVGGQYQTHYHNQLQVLVPTGELETLAERPDVQIVRQPRRLIPLAPLPVGSQTTEGVAASNASAWHAAGYDGTGVRVAIIDLGFAGYTGLLGTDLPASVTTYDWTGDGMEGGSPHGTACAEIVYDMAYGAAMDLHKISTAVELGNAVTQAITDGVDVISMSGHFPIDGPGDGTGNLADIVNTARSNGIFFAVAAGNEAEVSWSGTYVDSGMSNFHAWDGASLWLNYIVTDPGSGFCTVPPAGIPIQAGLHWDDWTEVNQDYDLHLYRFNGIDLAPVASSNYPQNGEPGQTPEEILSYTASGSDCYALVVERVNFNRDVCLSLDVPHMPHLEEWVPQRSLGFPADSADAVAVAAVDASTFNLESYSSQGPTFGPGGSCSGGTTKPDIAAYANVSTAIFGSGDFSGTSAATPHVAGAAALVKEAYPGYTVAQLQSFLEGRAADLGDPGKDNLYGSGRLDLSTPPGGNTPPAISGLPDQALLVDTSLDNAIDLWAYANDAESVDSALTFTVDNSPAADAGVSIDSNRYVDINPTPGWMGQTDVTILVTDTGVLSDTDSFQVTVGTNSPPNTPGSPSPADGATDQDANAGLAWTGGDPDPGNTVTYDVYLEANDSTPDALACDDEPTPACAPGPLAYDTHYYWYVVATDNDGASATSDTWEFTTEEQVVYLPIVMRHLPPPPATLYAVADASVLQGNPDFNDGDDSTMWVGYDHCDGIKIARGLVKFDASSIPAGASVEKATLYLNLDGSCDVGERTHTVTVYRTAASWSESSVTWNNKPGYAEAYGSRSIPSRTWGWYSFDVTGLVRGWVNGSFPDYGLMLRGPEGSGDSSARLSFLTHDYAGHTYAPYLDIKYVGIAASAETAPAAEDIPHPIKCGPTSKDSLVPSPVGPDDGAFEAVGETACPSD